MCLTSRWMWRSPAQRTWSSWRKASNSFQRWSPHYTSRDPGKVLWERLLNRWQWPSLVPCLVCSFTFNRWHCLPAHCYDVHLGWAPLLPAALWLPGTYHSRSQITNMRHRHPRGRGWNILGGSEWAVSKAVCLHPCPPKSVLWTETLNTVTGGGRKRKCSTRHPRSQKVFL